MHCFLYKHAAYLHVNEYYFVTVSLQTYCSGSPVPELLHSNTYYIHKYILSFLFRKEKNGGSCKIA